MLTGRLAAAVLPGVNPAITLKKGLQAAWNLTEASGDRADSYGAETLTDNNTVTGTTGPASFVNASYFTAANSESLSHADDAVLEVQTGSYAFCAWLNMTSLAGSGVAGIITKDDGSILREYNIHFVASTSRLRHIVYNGISSVVGVGTASSLGTPATSTWYFILTWVDRTGNTVNIQVNNGPVDTSLLTGTPGASSNAFYIGARGDAVPSSFIDGAIAGVNLWKRGTPPTPRESRWLYNNGAGRKYPW